MSDNERNICRYCDHEIDQQLEYCSEFCATATPEEKKAWRKLEVGDCGLYPCMNCGNPIDDMLYNKEERICASCSDGYRASKRKDLLKEVLVLLIAHCPPDSPDSQDLIERIKKELD